MDINKLIKLATLEKNIAAKEAFRAIKAELLLNASSKNPKPEGKLICVTGLDSWKENVEINELDLSIIRKLIKEREEQVSMYDANNRKDLAEMYSEQMKYLKQLLPPEISDNDIKNAIYGLYPNGFDKKEIGKVIKSVKEIYPTADSKIIAKIINEH